MMIKAGTLLVVQFPKTILPFSLSRLNPSRGIGIGASKSSDAGQFNRLGYSICRYIYVQKKTEPSFSVERISAGLDARAPQAFPTKL